MISFENLTPEERAESKKKEAGLITIAKITQSAKNEVKTEIALKLIRRGLMNKDISEDTGLSVEEIQQLRSEK